MSKLKKSDIVDISKQIKEFFNTSITARNSEFLSKFTFSNTELLEIFEISENIEKASNRISFYKSLICSQQGPFNLDVLNKFANVVYLDNFVNTDDHFNTLNHLFKLTPGVGTSNKLDWIKYFNSKSPYSFLHYCVLGRQLWFDITDEPFNRIFATITISYNIANKETIVFLHKLFSSMSDDDMYDWYRDEVEYQLSDDDVFEDQIVNVLTQFKDTSTKILVDFFDKCTTTSRKIAIAKHKNSPDKIKIEMYKYTKDETILPKKLKQLLIF